MAKIACSVCGKRMITDHILQLHMAKWHPTASEEKTLTEEFVSPVVPVLSTTPLVAPEPAPVVPNVITLRFKRPVEITINGIPYAGKSVEVKTMDTASEIVRIAREAYGSDILE